MSIRGLSAQAKMEASHKDPTTLPIMDQKNWTKNFEAIDEYFRGLRGHKKHPLQYVYHDALVSPLAAVDPQTGVVGSVYFSHDDEMIARGPILLAGAELALTPKLLGLSPRVSSSTGQRCGRSLLRFSSPMMPLQSSKPQRDPKWSTCLPTVVQALSWAQQRWQHGWRS